MGGTFIRSYRHVIKYDASTGVHVQVLCKKGRGAIRVLQAKTFGEAEKCTKFEKFVYILSVHVGTTCVVHFKLYSLHFIQKVFIES